MDREQTVSKLSKVRVGDATVDTWTRILTALSMPRVSNMMKKMTAHTDDPGSVAIASG